MQNPTSLSELNYVSHILIHLRFNQIALETILWHNVKFVKTKCLLYWTVHGKKEGPGKLFFNDGTFLEKVYYKDGKLLDIYSDSILGNFN